jgi:hypothetical protein
MQEHEKTFWQLVIMGGLIAMAKLLSGSEPITPRLAFGRMILGSALCVAAGAVLYLAPEIHPLALLGIASAMGIAGQQAVEAWVQRRGGFVEIFKRGSK